MQRENTIPVFTDSFVHLSMYSANRNRVQSKVGMVQILGYVWCYHVNVDSWYLSFWNIL